VDAHEPDASQHRTGELGESAVQIPFARPDAKPIQNRAQVSIVADTQFVTPLRPEFHPLT
jgi:hypothetical protein